MDNAYMRAEQKRQETERHATRLKEFLIYGADIPEDIQKQYGFSEDYRLYKELEEMDGRQYSEKRQKGEVPDAGKSAEDLPVQWKRHTKASAAVLRECISKDFTRNFCCSEA